MTPSPAHHAQTLGVYVQVPFCQAKCTYCNFSTGVFPRQIFEPYVDALCEEIRSHAVLYREAGLSAWAQDDTAQHESLSSGRARLQPCHEGSQEGIGLQPLGASSRSLAPNHNSGYVAETVYVGGGTPSLLDPASLHRILDAVRSAFGGLGSEVTLEADPETITAEKACAWREAGFNRISLGAQSFSDVELRAVGRRHRREDILAASRLLSASGFENVSYDLIAGLPHQTAETWAASLHELLRLHPRHISIYLLELDELSRLGREASAGGRRYGVPALPADDDAASFYETACARLELAGYDHYEISNWALPGFRSRHNLKYWRREPYLGFGAGAHSFDGANRWANVHDPSGYVAAIGKGSLALDERAPVTAAQAIEEELFLGLRQLDGIDLGAIERRYGVELRPRMRPLAEEGLVEWSGELVRLVPARLAISNEVFVRLLD